MCVCVCCYVYISQAIRYTLNIGMNYANAGPLFLAGVNESYRTEPPEEIGTFDKFLVCVCTVHMYM